ncbi:hypothetical protein QLQ12_25655 [Actinoplanes sp. NEAU-A12]|uniref:PH domain-containing protein n=1 Tax=Actinoplanes sandaracinus TaxID=3045177 RepID=A0ABT6WQK2_9ACTN|nr:hypothetical protein [Actinoplanes sandaracinus]MDI6102010.1 hypothetical protein [Actinoplanes sandaracinus]
MTEADRSVWVHADNSIYHRRLLVLAPFMVVGALLFGVRLAIGRPTSEGAGWWAAPATLIGLLLPLLFIAALLILRRLNACLVLENGTLYACNALRRWVRIADVDDLTGLHPVDVVVSSDQSRPDRMVITRNGQRPYVIDTRIWQQDEIRLLWRRLKVPCSRPTRPDYAELRKLFPGVRMPWLHVHPGPVIAMGSLATVAYIVLVVQLAFAG